MTRTRTSLTSSISLLALSVCTGGYGRGAYAGECAGESGSYLCFGAADPIRDRTQTITVTDGPLDVGSAPGFGLEVPLGDGIALTTYGADLGFVTDGGIEAERIALRIDNNGTGDTEVSVGDLAAGIGSAARLTNLSDGAFRFSSSGTLSGGVDGSAVLMINYGDGAVDVSINEAIAQNYSGVNMFNYGAGATRITASGTILSALWGVSAEHLGAGEIEISVTDVTAGREAAILGTVRNSTHTLITSSGTLRSDFSGISLSETDGGDTRIVVGDVISGGDGIVLSRLSRGNLEIEAHDIIGQTGLGIDALLVDSGDARITSTGVLSGGLEGYAMRIRARDSESNVTVGLNDVRFALGGVKVDTTGDVTLDIAGNVTDTNYETLIDRWQSLPVVNIASVQGGEIAVTTRGAVTGRGRAIDVASFDLRDINAASRARGTIDITAVGPVTGRAGGIDARTGGTVSVTSGDVTALEGNGIVAFGHSVTIRSSGTIRSGRNGIRSAQADSDGALSISARDILVTEAVLDPDDFPSEAYAQEIAASYGFGIRVGNTGDTPYDPGTNGGALSIAVSGNIVSPDDAIRTATFRATNQTITVTEIGSLLSERGHAIRDFGSDTNVLMQGVVHAGNVELGGGMDSFTLRGPAAMIADGVTVSGGDGADSLVFDGSSAVLSDAFTGFETTALRNGATLTLGAGFETGTLSTDASSVLSIMGSGQIAGTLANAGQVDMTGGAGGTFTVTGDFGGGTLAMDLDFATPSASDRLSVTGATGAGGATTLRFDLINPTEASTDDTFLLAEAGTAIAPGDFVLERGPLTVGALRFDLDTGSASGLRLAPKGFSDDALELAGLAMGIEQSAFGLLAARSGQVLAGRPEVARGLVAVERGAGPWLAAFGTRDSRDVEATSGPLSGAGRAETNSHGLRFGLDLPVSDGGDLTAGVSFGLASATQRTQPGTGAAPGRVDTESRGIFFNLDHRAGGLFAGAQLGYIVGDIDLDLASGATAETDASALALSLDLGWNMAMQNGAVFTFSGGLDGLRSEVDAFTDSSGARHAPGTHNSSRARLGVDVEAPFDAGPGLWTLRGGVQLNHTFGDARSTDVFGTTLLFDDSARTRGGVELGFDWTADNGATLVSFGVRHETALGGGHGNATSAALKLSVAF